MQKVKQFCIWLGRDWQAADNPLKHLSACRALTAACNQSGRAAGTDGKPSELLAKSLTTQLTKKSDFSGHFWAMTGNLDRTNPDTGKTEKPRFRLKKRGF